MNNQAQPITKTQLAVFLGIRMVINTMHRMVYPFLPVLARGMGVDLETFALAITFRAAAGGLSPFLSMFTENTSRRRGMLFGLILFLLGIGIFLVAPFFYGFVVLLILVTVGKYILDPAMQAYVGDIVPYEKRGQIIGILEIGWSLGFIVGVPVVGYLISIWGWKIPFPILFVLGILSVVAILKLIPDIPPTSVGRTPITNLLSVLRSKQAVAGLLTGFAMSAGNEMVNLVFGVWLEDAFAVKIGVLGATALVIGGAELVGEISVSGLSDRIGKKRSVGGGLLVGVAAATGMLLMRNSLVGAIIGLFIFYLAFEFALVSCISMMTELLPEARATLMGVNIAALSLGRAFAALIATQIYGLGIAASILGVGIFNILGLLALARIHEDS